MNSTAYSGCSDLTDGISNARIYETTGGNATYVEVDIYDIQWVARVIIL